MKGKKGIEQAVLVKMLGILASFILLAMLLHKVFDVAYMETAENKCRMSVVGHAKTQTLGTPVWGLDCPRKHITFDNEGYKTYYVDETPINMDKLEYKENFGEEALDKTKFYKILADEMGECWYKMGEGNLDIFEEPGFITWRMKCNICAQISFSKEFDKNVDLGTVGEFNEYLKNNNFTKYGIEQPYHDFLYREYNRQFNLIYLTPVFKQESIRPLFKESTELKPGKNYVVFFAATKWNDVTKTLNYLGESYTGKTINRIFPNDKYFVYFSEQEDITKSCAMVMN